MTGPAPHPCASCPPARSGGDVREFPHACGRDDGRRRVQHTGGVRVDGQRERSGHPGTEGVCDDNDCAWPPAVHESARGQCDEVPRQRHRHGDDRRGERAARARRRVQRERDDAHAVTDERGDPGSGEQPELGDCARLHRPHCRDEHHVPSIRTLRIVSIPASRGSERSRAAQRLHPVGLHPDGGERVPVWGLVPGTTGF